MPVGTWLDMGPYNNWNSWRVELSKRYMVYRAFVAAQRQQPRPGSSWLVLWPPADTGTWLLSYIIEAMSVFGIFTRIC